MAQSFYVRIVTDNGAGFSGFKPASPKMISTMKEKCSEFESWFGQKFKVQRFIKTPKGMKKV